MHAGWAWAIPSSSTHQPRSTAAGPSGVPHHPPPLPSPHTAGGVPTPRRLCAAGHCLPGQRPGETLACCRALPPYWLRHLMFPGGGVCGSGWLPFFLGSGRGPRRCARHACATSASVLSTTQMLRPMKPSLACPLAAGCEPPAAGALLSSTVGSSTQRRPAAAGAAHICWTVSETLRNYLPCHQRGSPGGLPCSRAVNWQ